MRYKFQFKST